MSKTITIAPVSRVEGHAKITIHLDDNGTVSEARFHVNEFRGFEKFCEGRLVWEMPGITSRICGICPASHLVASAMAGDEILSIHIPEAARRLRRILTLGQWIQSHALSFFHLSSPDFLLGMDSPPEKRNIFGLIEKDKEFATRGIRLRKFGQEVIEMIGGRKIHTPWAVAGGVRETLQKEKRDYLLTRIPESKETALKAIEVFKKFTPTFVNDIPKFGNFHTLYVGLVNAQGGLEYYQGWLRITDGSGNIIADKLDPRKYFDYFGEATEPWSYLKFPYYKPLGYPKGIYRVGPLARMNNCSLITTPLAEQERQLFKAIAGDVGVVNNSFYYHYARLIEILFAIEEIERLLNDPEIFDEHIRAKAMINRHRGVGVSEAPRGTLFHHYEVDDDGVLQKVNLLIATGQNNLAMNRTITQLAQHHIDSKKITEGMLNRIEAGIRCFDPCLSCSTHAFGYMPMRVQLIDASGTIVDEVGR
jgi:NAD-reducing hydrogenase large subunit